MKYLIFLLMYVLVASPVATLPEKLKNKRRNRVEDAMGVTDFNHKLNIEIITWKLIISHLFSYFSHIKTLEINTDRYHHQERQDQDYLKVNK